MEPLVRAYSNGEQVSLTDVLQGIGPVSVKDVGVLETAYLCPYCDELHQLRFNLPLPAGRNHRCPDCEAVFPITPSDTDDDDADKPKKKRLRDYLKKTPDDSEENSSKSNEEQEYYADRIATYLREMDAKRRVRVIGQDNPTDFLDWMSYLSLQGRLKFLGIVLGAITLLISGVFILIPNAPVIIYAIIIFLGLLLLSMADDYMYIPVAYHLEKEYPEEEKPATPVEIRDYVWFYRYGRENPEVGLDKETKTE